MVTLLLDLLQDCLYLADTLGEVFFIVLVGGLVGGVKFAQFLGEIRCDILGDVHVVEHVFVGGARNMVVMVSGVLLPMRVFVGMLLNVVGLVLNELIVAVRFAVDFDIAFQETVGVDDLLLVLVGKGLDGELVVATTVHDGDVSIF